MKNNQRAFTLIELLVVIAIIGILATISVLALNNARAKSRDAKRIADVKQMQTALELYFNDMNRYPMTSEFISSILSTSILGTTTYMVNIPSAPTPADGNCTNSDNTYEYISTDGSNYSISFCLGGNTGTLDAGVNTASPSGIVYGGPGSESGAIVCSCTDSNAPCCDNCDPTDAVCQGGTYCARTANCPAGQGCNNGTCVLWSCGDQVVVTTISGYTCNESAPYYDTCAYDTVQIGTQCWMKNNMNIGNMVTGVTTQTNNSPTPILEKYCYGDTSSNCQTDGGLYQWDEAMQYGTLSPGAQGICPPGWHIPTDAQQNTLDQYLNNTTCDANRFNAWGCADAGTKLKVGGSSGFEGVIAGRRDTNGTLNYRGVYGTLWSSSLNGSDAYDRYLGSGYPSVVRYADVRTYGFSVRCLKD